LTQCVNLVIFLPSKFLREINYGKFRGSNVAILTVFETLILNFPEIQGLEKGKNPLKAKAEALKMSQVHFLGF